jgi:hypothetical protein
MDSEMIERALKLANDTALLEAVETRLLIYTKPGSRARKRAIRALKAAVLAAGILDTIDARLDR